MTDRDMQREIDRLRREVDRLRQALGNLPVRWGRGGGGGDKPIRVTVTAVGSDTLTCLTPDGQTITAAKPDGLRHAAGYYADLTSLTTVNAQRCTVVRGSETETWQVNLPYFVGCAIYVDYQPIGGTGMADNNYIDDNRDGRKWGVVE